MRFLTWNEVCRRRLARHYLTRPASSTQLVDVVRAVCGVQAQIITAAELAIGARARVFAHGRGRFEGAAGLPVLLIDGIVAGMWERRPRGRRVELRVESFIRLTAAQRRQLEAEAVRIGEFFDAEVALSLGALG